MAPPSRRLFHPDGPHLSPTAVPGPRNAKTLLPTLTTTSPSQGSSCHAPGLARQYASSSSQVIKPPPGQRPPSVAVRDRRHDRVGQVPRVHEQRPGHVTDRQPQRGEQLLAVPPGAAFVAAEALTPLPQGAAEAPRVPAVALPGRQPRTQLVVVLEHGPAPQPLRDLA